jgi:hypothetical protein
MSSPESRENRHGGCVRAGHLDGERSLDLVARCGGINHGKRRIQSDLRNTAAWQPSCGL